MGAIRRRVGSGSKHLMGRSRILLQLPAAPFTVPISIFTSVVSVGNLRGISSWRPRRVAEAGGRRTLGRMARVRGHSRGVTSWDRGGRCRRRSDLSRGGREVWIMAMGMPITTIRRRGLRYRLVQQDARMPTSRRPAAGGIQRRRITVVSRRTIDIHGRKPGLVMSGLVNDHRGRWTSSERSR